MIAKFRELYRRGGGGCLTWAIRSIVLPLVLLSPGCVNYFVTNPPRSATEQLLISTAADRAIATISLADFNGKRVFLETNYFDSYDSKYALGAFRDALSVAGARLESDITKSEIVIEVRSGGLSIDASDSLVGVPKIGMPIPLTGAVDIPEIALYKGSRQHSTAKFALLAYRTESRDHVFSSGPAVGKAYSKQYKLLGLVQWTLTDVPEKKRERKEKKKR